MSNRSPSSPPLAANSQGGKTGGERELLFISLFLLFYSFIFILIMNYELYILYIYIYHLSFTPRNYEKGDIYINYILVLYYIIF